MSQARRRRWSMNGRAGDQARIAEISQGRIVDLDNINTGLDQGLRLTFQNLGQVLKEVLKSRIGLPTVVGVPVADRNQKRAGQRELRDTVGMCNQKARIRRENRSDRAHALHDNVGELDFALMRVLTASFKTTDARQEFTDVLRPPPLAVTDDIQAGLFLQTNGEEHKVVECSLKGLRRHSRTLGQQITNDLGPRQGTDALSIKQTQIESSLSLHELISSGVRWRPAIVPLHARPRPSRSVPPLKNAFVYLAMRDLSRSLLPRWSVAQRTGATPCAFSGAFLFKCRRRTTARAFRQVAKSNNHAAIPHLRY